MAELRQPLVNSRLGRDAGSSTPTTMLTESASSRDEFLPSALAPPDSVMGMPQLNPLQVAISSDMTATDLLTSMVAMPPADVPMLPAMAAAPSGLRHSSIGGGSTYALSLRSTSVSSMSSITGMSPSAYSRQASISGMQLLRGASFTPHSNLSISSTTGAPAAFLNVSSPAGGSSDFSSPLTAQTQSSTLLAPLGFDAASAAAAAEDSSTVLNALLMEAYTTQQAAARANAAAQEAGQKAHQQWGRAMALAHQMVGAVPLPGTRQEVGASQRLTSLEFGGVPPGLQLGFKP